MLKKCARCKREKDTSEFVPINVKLVDGSIKQRFKSYCRRCWADKGMAFHKANRPKQLEKKCRYSRLQNYGLTWETFLQMFENQEGLCGICSCLMLLQSGSKRQKNSVCVDHDHVTGKIRGLLCHNCNVGLGHFRDNARLLKHAIGYLDTAVV